MDTFQLLPSERIVNAGRPAERGRAAAWWITIAMTGAVIGASLYLQEGALRFGTDAWRTLVADRQASSRLPRPRPDEPVTTGSIRRVDAPPAPVLSRSLKEEIERAASLAIEAEDRARLRDKAVLVASDWADCAEVLGSEVLERAGNSLVVRIDCANAVSFDLGKDEIEASASSKLLQAAAGLSDAQAVATCEAMVRRGLPYPASLHRSAPSTGVVRMPGSDAVVTFDFEALNGLSFPIFMRAHCVFAQQELARLEVSPR